MIPAPPAHRSTRSARRVGAAAMIAVLTLGACTSDPGARRVAEDIIEAEFEAEAISESEKDCMFEVLEDDYSESDFGL